LKIENGFELVNQFQTLFIFKVFSDSKICKKDYLINIVLIENGKIVNSLNS
jgi:hypothetical protein